MNLIEFFGVVVKPKKVKGKKMMSPKETFILDRNIYFIRDKDVNAFLIKSDNGFVAIDSGYKNSANMVYGLDKLNVDTEKVCAVLLTHLDLDHAGGMDKRCEIIYPKAKVYVGKNEARYLTKELSRKKILGIKLSSPIKLKPGYFLLEDKEIITIDGVKIQAFLTPGHTLGHLSYLINDTYLFVGDTLIMNKNGGYCFWDFWNIDSSLNKDSLERLYKIAKENNVKYVITSHNGYSDDIEFAFKNKGEFLDWNKKGFIFDSEAPFDAYK